MEKIKIEFSGNVVEAGLNDTRTSKKIFDALPIKGIVNTWGDEIYFKIPLDEDLEEAGDILEEGDIAFWPPGNAFCIFFGPTPISTDGRPRAAGPVTVLGRVLKKSDFNVLRSALEGHEINLSR